MGNKSVVILCGGKGSRMGALTNAIPKPMLEVQGKPIIWYIYNILYNKGVKDFYFITGYKHEKISFYIKENFKKEGTNISVIDTGEDTEIAQRISCALPEINSNEFLLVNADTIFDFNIDELYKYFYQNEAKLVLTAIPATSKYGLIIKRNGEIVSFERESKVKNVVLENNLSGFINSGISLISKDLISNFDLKNCIEYESEFYTYCIKNSKTLLYEIDGFWYAMDTPKDILIANGEEASKDNIFEKVKKILNTLV